MLQLLRECPITLPVHSVQAHWLRADGARLLSRGYSKCMGDTDTDVILMDLDSGERLFRRTGDSFPATPSPSGRVFAINEGRLELRETETGGLLGTTKGSAYCFGPGGDVLAGGSGYARRRRIVVVEVPGCATRWGCRGGSASFSSDGRSLLVKVDKTRFEVRASSSGQVVSEIAAPPEREHRAWFSEDCRAVITESMWHRPPYEHHRWHVDTGQELDREDAQSVRSPDEAQRYATSWSPAWHPASSMQPFVVTRDALGGLSVRRSTDGERVGELVMEKVRWSVSNGACLAVGTLEGRVLVFEIRG